MLHLNIGICDDDKLYIKEITKLLDRYMIQYDIDISYDRVIIDAKSFLGVLGLGVSRVLTVTYCGKDMDFENTVQKYAVAQLTAQKKVCIEQVIYDGRKGSVDISIEMFADPFCMHYNERR